MDGKRYALMEIRTHSRLGCSEENTSYAQIRIVHIDRSGRTIVLCMIGDLSTIEKSPSAYSPSQEIKNVTASVQTDYAYGHNILTKPWAELNEHSVIEDMNNGRLMFNAFVDENVEDPAQAWKWRGTRSKARNKGIAMHANLTAAYLIPSFVAQNDDSQEDRDMSDFMRDIVEWLAENSEYKSNFLALVFAMETDPVVYLGAEWNEVFQKIKIKQEDGSYTTKEILDEVLSGFRSPIYTADQVLISNAFDRNIQRHRTCIKRRWIEYEEAEAKYGEKTHWNSVHPGMRVVYSSSDGLFYDTMDPDHAPHLVEECTYMNRRNDTEIAFVGGVYMGDENVDANPMRHRDNYDAPRYNIAPFGFYPIGSHFFYFKSMMNAMKWDNMLYDAMSEIVMNRSILEVDMPIAVSGSDKIDTEIVFPNSVTTFSSADTKITPLLPASNMAAAMKALTMTEESMSESSISDAMMGQLPPTAQRAFVVAQAQANAKKLIGDVAKGLAASVSQYGLLMSDIALTHLTVPKIDEIEGDESKMKYPSFVLNKKNIGGHMIAKQLSFDENLLGASMSQEEKDQYSLKLLERVNYPDNTKHLYVANPGLFARMKYLCRSDYEELFPQNQESMQAMLTALYTQLRADPLIDPQWLLRKLSYAYFKGEGDSLIAKTQPAVPGAGAPGAPAAPNALGAQAMQKGLSPAATRATTVA